MALEKVTTDNSKANRLTACPACDVTFDDGEDRAPHVEEHAPEDFGLSPIGEGVDEWGGNLSQEEMDLIAPDWNPVPYMPPRSQRLLRAAHSEPGSTSNLNHRFVEGVYS